MPNSDSDSQTQVVLGVSGSIAAYKALTVLRLLKDSGIQVQVVPTKSALRLIGAPTWEAISGSPVHADVFEGAAEVDHVRLGKTADLVMVVPATANILAKAAAGLADDLLTNTLLMAQCPVLMAPAMHTQMWQHAATRQNVETLRQRNICILEPETGKLTGSDVGPGRLPEPEIIVAEALRLLTPPDLAGTKVLISAGGTREPIDPVRFLGNESSGRQGVALAREAQKRGAAVTLVAANVAPELTAGLEVVSVSTAQQLHHAMKSRLSQTDVVIMAAAVADFRPEEIAVNKLKKDPTNDTAPTLKLVRTPDILMDILKSRPSGCTVVGFAAETGPPSEVLSHGMAKALRKGSDLTAVNAVGGGLGFGDVPNSLSLIDAKGNLLDEVSGTKEEVAALLWNSIKRLRLGSTAYNE